MSYVKVKNKKALYFNIYDYNCENLNIFNNKSCNTLNDKVHMILIEKFISDLHI